MKPTSGTDHELLALCVAYADQSITREQIDRLESLLVQDSRNLDFYLEFMSVCALLERWYGNSGLSLSRYALGDGMEGLSSVDADVLKSAAQALAELAQHHNEGLGQPLDLHALQRSVDRHAHGSSRRIRLRLRTRIAIAGGLAALIALGVGLALAVSLLSKPGPQLAETQEPGSLRAVATLSDQQDAVWSSEDGRSTPAPGDKLYPGQRLALAEGFARITTNRGAVATLQGPCDVELLNNDNAIHLHAGKLIGLVRDEQALGLRIRTDRMTVVDLGTRFGVAIDDAGNSVAEVFEGDVVVERGSPSEDGFKKLLLARGDSVALDAQGRQIDRDRLGLDLFDSLAVYKTGVAELSGEVQMSAIYQFRGLPASLWPDESAYVFEELRNHRLESDIPLTLSKPGSYERFDMAEPSAIIKRGTVISSYILVCSGKGKLTNLKTSSGRITFDGEVLGVVTNLQWQPFIRAMQDEAGDALFTDFDPELNGLEYTSRLPNFTKDHIDRIVLEQDRRTLGCRLTTSVAADIVRVIVRETTGETSQ